MSEAAKSLATAITDLAAVLCLTGILLAPAVVAAAGTNETPAPAQTADPRSKSTAPTPPPTPPPAAQQDTSLARIAADAKELDRLLKELDNRLATDDNLPLEQNLQSSGAELVARRQQLDDLMNSLPSTDDLLDLEYKWQELGARLDTPRKALSRQAAMLDQSTINLKSQKSLWETTLNQIQTDASLQELAERVRQSVSHIDATQATVQARLKLTVTLQNRLSEQDKSVAEAVEKIENARALQRRSLLEPDSRPLWQWQALRQTDASLESDLRRYYAPGLIRLREFARARRQPLFVALFIFLIVLATGLKVRRRTTSNGEVVKTDWAYVFQRPFSLAMFAGLLTMLPLAPSAPAIVKGIVALLYVVPVLRLLGPTLERSYRHLLYALLASNLAVQAWQVTSISLSLKRGLLALLSLIIPGGVVWLLFQTRQVRRPGLIAAMLRAGRRFWVLVIFASFFANLFGYFRLSQMLIVGMLLGAYYGVILYVAKWAISVVWSAALHSDRAGSLAVVQQQREAMTRWMQVILSVAAFVVWALVVLNLFTLRTLVLAAAGDLLTYQIKLGAVSFTPGDILRFLVVLVLGIIVAGIIRLVLREDILKRLPLKRGVPYALSTVTYYLLLLVIFVLALVAGGIELSKLTLLTGAFGIGIGFGLQNTINNFASGLILLFERPIRVGDLLEVEGYFGEVLRIGMRSTSIRTEQGSEVIAPNSSLVADKVINWSRLGKRRRAELPVRVAYGTSPQTVIELLIRTAAAHSEVLREPAVDAFFNGFGETALEFTLAFWVPCKYHRRLRSEIAIRISDALADAGIEVPLPQHLHLRSVDASVRELLEPGKPPE
jgi:small-conductance mechanosensitive channel